MKYVTTEKNLYKYIYLKFLQQENIFVQLCVVIFFFVQQKLGSKLKRIKLNYILHFIISYHQNIIYYFHKSLQSEEFNIH